MYKCSPVVFLIGLLTGCGLQSNPEGRLGVPYYAQEQHNYCVPASIKMWRDFDGVTPQYSQDHIWSAIGGAPCSGSDAAGGVRQFTATGFDAYQDIESPSSYEDFMARQITSISRQIPVMVVVHDSRDHVGILNGGKYVSEGARHRWEFVYFHDPDPFFGGANMTYVSDDWIDLTCLSGVAFCAQIIAEWATDGWAANLQQWGGSVDTYLSDGPTQEHEN